MLIHFGAKSTQVLFPTPEAERRQQRAGQSAGQRRGECSRRRAHGVSGCIRRPSDSGWKPKDTLSYRLSSCTAKHKIGKRAAEGATRHHVQ